MTETVRDRLDERAIARRLARLDELLEGIEAAPGPMTQAAIEAVQALTEVYGEALARVLDGAGAELADRLAGDELLGHLMVLHGIHPEPVDRRVSRAVDNLRPAVRKSGGEIHLAGVEDGVANVRLRAGGCGSSSTAVEDAVREAVLAVAPELTDVRRVPEPEREKRGQAAFVPLDALTGRTAGAGKPS
ncbi:NifU family protein [Streptomyces sp. NPDC008313]|uniref:NifU family protein n=1 Tax=Streptomyces sp. NPDC008313 TaxID=3364826 RepID=UPI0036EE8453